MVQFFEIMMLVLFGLSWPFNIAKSWQSKTAKSKSVIFDFILLTAYACGLVGKFVSYSETGELAISTWFYIIDIILVATDVCLYFRNTAIDRANEAKIIEEDLIILQETEYKDEQIKKY